MTVQSLEQVLASDYVLLFARTLVGLVLLVAGLSKLNQGRKFVQVVRTYKLLPEMLAAPVGRLVPVAEVSVALLLFTNLLQPWTPFAAALLFLIFGAAIAINLLRGRSHISCGCFGAGEGQRLSWALVARNLLFAALALLPLRAGDGAAAATQLPAEEAAATVLLAIAALASLLMLDVIAKLWPLPDVNQPAPLAPKRRRG